VQHDIVSRANKSVHTIDGQPNRSTLVRRANEVRSALARSEDKIRICNEVEYEYMDDRVKQYEQYECNEYASISATGS
jgi:hypothetical protein